MQSVVLSAWIIVNVVGWINAWDPYPFILLNLVLSFQAAYAAPIIMMSQNRQAAIDRHNAENAYRINVKAELEIELLHQKFDLLREQEVLESLRLVTTLERRLVNTESSSTEVRTVRDPPSRTDAISIGSCGRWCC